MTVTSRTGSLLIACLAVALLVSAATAGAEEGLDDPLSDDSGGQDPGEGSEAPAVASDDNSGGSVADDAPRRRLSAADLCRSGLPGPSPVGGDLHPLADPGRVGAAVDDLATGFGVDRTVCGWLGDASGRTTLVGSSSPLDLRGPAGPDAGDPIRVEGTRSDGRRPGAAAGPDAGVASEGSAPIRPGRIAAPVPAATTIVAGLASGTVALVVLYRRISGDDLLEHDLRGSIVRTVREEPGIERSELVDRIEVHPSTLDYHVRILEEADLLESRVVDGRKLLFCPDAHDRRLKAVRSALRHDARRRIARAIEAEPGLNLSEVAEATDLSVRMAHYHVDELVERDVLEVERDGRSKRLRVREEVRDLVGA